MLFSEKVYIILKWIVQLLLPGSATLYFALAAIWGFPYPEQIIGTISAVTVFLGILLGISTAAYNKTDEVKAIERCKDDKTVQP